MTFSKPLLGGLCLATLLVTGVRAAAQDRDATTAARSDSIPGSRLRVWLVTMGPGDEVWERYGHNAIRILDTRTGRDASYNWGVFDFRQSDFISRFLRGRMLYQLAVYPTQPMVAAYADVNREVVVQELDLTPAQKLELLTLVERNALPENAQYLYQYFLDNCSTRVRDMLDRVLGGSLRAEFDAEETGTTYRFHTRRLTEVDPLIYTGMDALLGTPTDQPLTAWDEMFIPMELRDLIRDFTVTGPDGASHALVSSEDVVVRSTREPEASQPPHWLPIYLAIGVALGLLFATLAATRVKQSAWLRRGVLTVATAWSLLGGVLGTILVLLLLTDHTFAYRNENLFLFNPLVLAIAVLLPLSGRSDTWLRRARRVLTSVVAVALTGLVWQLAPWSHHQNAMFFALGLPSHLGLAYGLGVRGSVGLLEAA